MSGETIDVEGFLAKFPTPVLPKIGGELTRESLIDLHQMFSENVASVDSNLGGYQNGHLALTMTGEEYTTHTGYAFVPPHNPGGYPPTMGTAQDQGLGTEKS